MTRTVQVRDRMTREDRGHPTPQGLGDIAQGCPGTGLPWAGAVTPSGTLLPVSPLWGTAVAQGSPVPGQPWAMSQPLRGKFGCQRRLDRSNVMAYRCVPHSQEEHGNMSCR